MLPIDPPVMKKFLPLGVTCLAASLLLTAASASAPQGDLEKRVAQLEDTLAAEKKAHHETRAVLEQVQRYLEKQASAAKSMQTTLDQAEKEGFAKGINFQSRVTLLDGWRSILDAAQNGVPKVATKNKKKDTRRSPRR